MNLLVIGLGSMGKRRIRLIKKNYPLYTIIGIDTNLERTLECEKAYNITTYSSIKEACNSLLITSAFICTSPLSHNAIIKDCLSHNLHVFTELNLVSDGYEDNITLAKNKNLTLFLSSTALYRKEMEYIINKVHQTASSLNYNYHVGQYLPDWHPWEDYRDYFIGNKITNGCREIFAIELPWLIKAFGRVSNFQVISNKMTSLDIDYNDNYLLLLQHESGAKGVLTIDVVSREAVRKFEVFGEELYLHWDGKPDTLKNKDLKTKSLDTISLYDNIEQLENYSSTIIENQYFDEINCFFHDILHPEEEPQTKYTFTDDLYTLSLIDRIELKASKGELL